MSKKIYRDDEEALSGKNHVKSNIADDPAFHFCIPHAICPRKRTGVMQMSMSLSPRMNLGQSYGWRKWHRGEGRSEGEDAEV